MSAQREFILPTSIVSPTDISRLLREIESVDAFFQQNEIRQAGEQQNAMPRLSKLMDTLTTENKINLLQSEHRQYVKQSLEYLHGSAPVVHMSFSVDPPGSYTQKIVAWMRANIHGTVLVTVGLQPNIGAGCVVRTTNKIFDFSLREYFHEKRDFFIQEMHKAVVDPSNSDEGAQIDAAPAEATAPQQLNQPAAEAPAAVTSAPAPAEIPQPTKEAPADELPAPVTALKKEETAV